MDYKVYPFTKISKVVLISFLLIIVVSCNGDESDPVNEPPAEVTGFYPLEGLEGTKVTITGNNFGDNPGGVSIAVDDKYAQVTHLSNTEIKFVAPANARGVEADVKLTIRQESQLMNEKFVYPNPKIDDFYPKFGVLFQNIVLKGGYFSDNSDNVRVLMDGRDLPVISSSLDSVVVTTTDGGLLLKKFPFQIIVDGISVTSDELYTHGLQYQFSDAGFHSLGFCPGSTIEINITDNRNPSGSMVISSDVVPDFTYNDLQPVYWVSRIAENDGRHIRMSLPTSLDVGTASIKARIDGFDLLAAGATNFSLEEGYFQLSANEITLAENLAITLSHHFVTEDLLLVKFKNVSTQSETVGEVSNADYTETGALRLFVATPAEAGQYVVSVFTADGVYEFIPDGDPQVVITE